MSNRYLGGFITASYSPLVSTFEYLVVAGGAGGGAGLNDDGGAGGSGAVRIIWSTVGTSRSFPSTNTGNL